MHGAHWKHIPEDAWNTYVYEMGIIFFLRLFMAGNLKTGIEMHPKRVLAYVAHARALSGKKILDATHMVRCGITAPIDW